MKRKIIIALIALSMLFIIDLMWWTRGVGLIFWEQQSEGEQVEWGSALDGWCNR